MWWWYQCQAQLYSSIISHCKTFNICYCLPYVSCHFRSMKVTIPPQFLNGKIDLVMQQMLRSFVYLFYMRLCMPGEEICVFWILNKWGVLHVTCVIEMGIGKKCTVFRPSLSHTKPFQNPPLPPSSTPWALDILNVQLLKSLSPWWWCSNAPTPWTRMGKINCGKEQESPLNTCFPSHMVSNSPP